MDNKQFIKIKDSPLPIMIIILGLIAGLIFYFQIIKPRYVEIIELPQEVREEFSQLKKFKDLRLNFSIFESSDFKNLKVFGEVPVKPQKGGKTDLFSP